MIKTYHDREDTLLHLTGVLSAKNDHLHPLEVDLDGGSGAHALGEAVGRELTSIVDDEVRLAKLRKLLLRWTDKHVVLLKTRSAHSRCIKCKRSSYHEEGVVSTGADNPDLDSVFGIPLNGQMVE